ncbi:MAG: DUF983 domain-containing protein [Chitinophagaceae bacterium]|nr:MAG: DUF983 domain-containing protein [Chitinophagaceae bacterium]
MGKSKSYLTATIQCRCPRCRKGKLFMHPLSFKLKQTFQMNKVCTVCSQPTEIEVGFYYGTGYVSYALTVAISVASFLAWLVLIGMSVKDNRFFIWMGCNAVLLIVLQPWLMRLSRSIWISWFVRYDPDWKNNPV